MTRLVIACALAAAAALGLAATGAAAATTVLVEEATPRPRTVAIPPGESVEWTNRDDAAHRIASDTGAWRPFAVAPGGSHRLRFGRAGRYRYRVDGRARGLVIVGAAVRRRAAPPPPVGTRFHRYDVTATVSARYREDQPTDPDPRLVGSQEITFSWTHRFRRVRVRVISTGTLVQATTAPIQARGTVRPVMRFEEGRTLFSGPCRGVVTFPVYRSRFFIGGTSGLGRVASHLNGGAQIATLALATDVDRRALEAQRAACPGTATDPPVGPPVAPDFPRWMLGDMVTAEGVRIPEPGNPFSTLTTELERRGGGRLPFPLDRLAHGRGFVVDTGPRIALGACGTGCTSEAEGRVRWEFRPVRP